MNLQAPEDALSHLVVWSSDSPVLIVMFPATSRNLEIYNERVGFGGGYRHGFVRDMMDVLEHMHVIVHLGGNTCFETEPGTLSFAVAFGSSYQLLGSMVDKRHVKPFLTYSRWMLRRINSLDSDLRHMNAAMTEAQGLLRSLAWIDPAIDMHDVLRREVKHVARITLNTVKELRSKAQMTYRREDDTINRLLWYNQGILDTDGVQGSSSTAQSAKGRRRGPGEDVSRLSVSRLGTPLIFLSTTALSV